MFVIELQSVYVLLGQVIIKPLSDSASKTQPVGGQGWQFGDILLLRAKTSSHDWQELQFAPVQAVNGQQMEHKLSTLMTKKQKKETKICCMKFYFITLQIIDYDHKAILKQLIANQVLVQYKFNKFIPLQTIIFSYCSFYYKVIRKESMKFNDILMITLANTPIMKEKKIRDLYKQMQQRMNKLDEADGVLKSKTQKLYLKAFMNVMEKMGAELLQAKQRYQNLDKQKLKIQKCEKLAEDIKLFRQECYITKKKLQQAKTLIKKQKLRQEILKRQEDALNHCVRKIQMSKKQNKKDYERLRSYLEEEQYQEMDYNEKEGNNKNSYKNNEGQNDKAPILSQQQFCKKRISKNNRNAQLNDQTKQRMRKRPKSTNNCYFEHKSFF